MITLSKAGDLRRLACPGQRVFELQIKLMSWTYLLCLDALHLRYTDGNGNFVPNDVLVLLHSNSNAHNQVDTITEASAKIHESELVGTLTATLETWR